MVQGLDNGGVVLARGVKGLPRTRGSRALAAATRSHSLASAALQAVTGDGYDAILSAPWYLNLGCYATDDWKKYYAGAGTLADSQLPCCHCCQHCCCFSQGRNHQSGATKLHRGSNGGIRSVATSLIFH